LFNEKGSSDVAKKKRTFNHGDYETRQRKARERLRLDDAKCIFCPEPDPIALHLHHVAQRDYSDETVAVCATHHAKLSDRHKDRPPRIEDCTSPLQDIAHFLFSLADMLVVGCERETDADLRGLLTYVVGKLNQFGTCLIDQARETTQRSSKKTS
jgi:hypothetical protein